MGRQGFKELLVWQQAEDLAVQVYRISNASDLNKDFGLRDQMRRSAVSVACNLAEGDERGSDRDAVRFFYMAKGSVAELRTQIQIARDVGLLNHLLYEEVESACVRIGKMIGALIKVRSQVAPIASSHSPRTRM